jgi:O-antigen/teichoic acid export membrane protein
MNLKQTAEPIIPDEPKPADIGKAARQGGLWSVISYSVTKVAGFASSIVLARLLMPEHFGLIGMVNTVLGLVQMFGNCGIGFALIHQRKDVKEYANTTYWLDIAAGVILLVAANACVPLAINYYSEPAIRYLLVVSSINFIISPLGGTMSALMARDLRFKDNARINLAGGIITSALTIAMALCGAGVWSFVFPTIVSNIAIVIMRWRACSWRPSIRVKWSLSKKLIGFGWKMFAAQIFEYINQNADYILIGRMLGGKQLGLYVFAYNLGIWVVQNVSTTIGSIAFPTFASVQNEPEHAKKLFLKLIRMIALIGFPIVALQWAMAPLYIGTIYGQKWLPSVFAFQLIAVYGIGRAVCQPGGTLISAVGRPDINLKISACATPILLTAILIGSRYGINGVAGATAVAHGLFVWLYIFVPFRILKWRLSDAFGSLAPAFFSSVFAAFGVGLAWRVFGSPTASLLLLFGLLIFGVILYCTAFLTVFRSTGMEAIDLVTKSIKEARSR